MSSKTTLHERLRLAREQSGLSQGQVAKLMDLHRPTISEIEAGRRKVAADEIARFAEIYHVSLEWLVEGSVRPATLELAARELSKLGEEDLRRVLELISTIKAKGASQ